MEDSYFNSDVFTGCMMMNLLFYDILLNPEVMAKFCITSSFGTNVGVPKHKSLNLTIFSKKNLYGDGNGN